MSGCPDASIMETMNLQNNQMLPVIVEPRLFVFTYSNDYPAHVVPRIFGVFRGLKEFVLFTLAVDNKIRWAGIAIAEQVTAAPYEEFIECKTATTAAAILAVFLAPSKSMMNPSISRLYFVNPQHTAKLADLKGVF